MPSQLKHEINKIRGVVKDTIQISDDNIALIRESLDNAEIAIKELQSNKIDQSTKINTALSKANQALSKALNTSYNDLSIYRLKLTNYIKPNGLTGFFIRDTYNTIQSVLGVYNKPNMMDVITEMTVDNGVTIDGTLLKDGKVDGRDASIDGTKLDTIAPNADVSGVKVLKTTVLYTDEGNPVSLGFLPANVNILDIAIETHTQFNDSGTDLLNIGLPTLHTYFVNQSDISGGLYTKAPVLNTWGNTGGLELFAYYEGQNNDANNGVAYITLIYVTV